VHRGTSRALQVGPGLHLEICWADLPIIVATRMSLSFPGLISAVPLYDVDYTKPENVAASRSVQAL
jgi:hypothetical protein